SGTIYATNGAILIGSGTGSSVFSGALFSRVRVMIQTGVNLNYTAFSECSPPAADAGADVNFCAGGSAALGSAAAAGVTYGWSPSTGLSSSTVSNPTVTLASAGTTTYTVTATSGTCVSSDQVVVTSKPYPTADAGLDRAFCSGSSA